MASEIDDYDGDADGEDSPEDDSMNDNSSLKGRHKFKRRSGPPKVSSDISEDDLGDESVDNWEDDDRAEEIDEEALHERFENSSFVINLLVLKYLRTRLHMNISKLSRLSSYSNPQHVSWKHLNQYNGTE